MDYDRAKLRADLERDEGRVHFPYKDSKGILTVGVGWNLEANGIPAEVKVLLTADGDPMNGAYWWPDSALDRLLDIGIVAAEKVLGELTPAWRDFPAEIQRALLNMAFNLGAGHSTHGLSNFPHFLAAVNAGDWKLAGEQLDAEHSPKWNADVGPRAHRIAAVFDSTGDANA